MKKYLLGFAVLMMSMIGFTACSDDDDPTSDSLAKTSWAGQIVDDGIKMDVTISFTDDKNGVEYAKGTISDPELPMPITMEQYAKFTYSFDGKKGKAVVSQITTKTPFGTETYNPKEDEDFEEGDDQLEFVYDASSNTLKVYDGDGLQSELKKVAYQKIEVLK